MAGNPGIFIRSPSQDIGKIISSCKEFLCNLECSAVIKALVSDSKYGGYRLYFSEETAVNLFLKEKYLPMLSEEKASIHPLTTILAVHDIIPESVDNFKQVLRAQLERMGLKPILGICPIPIAPEHPDILSGNWLVDIDIPEIEDLDVFKNNGLPDHMRLSLMFKKNAPDQVVTHYCVLCDSIDHSRQHCSIIGDFFSKEQAEQSFPKFEIRDRTQYNTAGSSKSAKQHRIEAIASDLERKKKIQSHMCNVTVKKEIEDDSTDLLLKQELKHELSPPRDKPLSLKRKMKTDRAGSSKKIRYSSDDLSGDEEDTVFEFNATASSTTGKETPKISNEIHKPTFPSSFQTQQPFDSGNSDDDEFSLPNLPTSSQPETNIHSFSADQTSKDAFDSDSSEIPKKPKYVRRKPTYAPVVLPDRIKQIVLDRDLKEGELDVGQLEAFFNHVKKKMCPAKIAERFTSNVECLQKQLNWIIQEYYHTPKAGSGEDSRFMKWLEGMLARFDATPTVRKKARS